MFIYRLLNLHLQTCLDICELEFVCGSLIHKCFSFSKVKKNKSQSKNHKWHFWISQHALINIKTHLILNISNRTHTLTNDRGNQKVQHLILSIPFTKQYQKSRDAIFIMMDYYNSCIHAESFQWSLQYMTAQEQSHKPCQQIRNHDSGVSPVSKVCRSQATPRSALSE